MTKTYRNFILESLCESIMIASADFMDIIKIMRSDNRIADTLYDLIQYRSDIKTNYNAIGLSDKNDEISFIPDSQYQRIVTNGEDPWTKTKSKSKIGRAVRQILGTDYGGNITDSKLEEFVNLFKTIWDKKMSPKKLDIVKSDKILDWYDEETYSESGGTLGNSCMRSPSKRNYMKIYADNDDKISMVILTDSSNKLLARAILWKVDVCDNTKIKYYLDRIYVRYDSDYLTVYNWVIDNVVKGDSEIISSQKNGGNNENEMIVNIKKVNFEKYPYADTFVYLFKEIDENGRSTGRGFLTNRNVKEKFTNYVGSTLQDTGGQESVFTHKYSKIKDRYLTSDEAIYIDSIGDYVGIEDCKRCNYKGIYILNDDAVYSDSMKDWIPKGLAIKSEKFGIVLSGVVISVIIKYNGSDDPFISYLEFITKKEDIEVEERLKTSDGYFKSRIQYYRSEFFDSKFLVNDINGYEYCNLVCAKFFKVKDYTKLSDKNIYYSYRSNYYISKEESDFYSIEVNETETTYVHIETLTERYDPSFYLDILYNEYPDKTKEEISNYKAYLEKIHNIKIILESRYKDYFNMNRDFISTKIDPLQLIIDIYIKSSEEHLKNKDDDIISKYSIPTSQMSIFKKLVAAFNLYYKYEGSFSSSYRRLIRLSSEYYDGKITDKLISSVADYAYDYTIRKTQEIVYKHIENFKEKHQTQLSTSSIIDFLINKIRPDDITKSFSNMDISSLET